MNADLTFRVANKLADFVEDKLKHESTDTLVEAFVVLIVTQALESHVSLKQVQELVAEVYLVASSRAARAKVRSLKLVPPPPKEEQP